MILVRRLRDVWTRSRSSFRVGMTIGVLLVFAAAMGLGRLAGADGGSYADWLSATSTLAAFAAALVAARYAAGAFTIETARERRWEESSERSQAELIAAWPAHIHYMHRYDAATEREITAAVQGFLVLVRNTSPLPVTQVRVEVSMEVPGDPVAEILIVNNMALLAPSPEAQTLDLMYPSPRSIDDFWPDGDIGLFHRLRVDLSFRDASGIRWWRTWDGHLSRVNEIAGT